MLRLTDAGRAAMMDGTNRQTNAVQLRSMQIGDGMGPGGEMDDSRAALRSERNSEVVVGTTMVSGRLALRGDFAPTDVYSVTEVGLIARIGAGGNEFLFAYLAVPSATDAIATTVVNTTLIIAGVIDVTNSAAEINVTVAASITFAGPGTFVELSDVPGVITADRYLRGNNTATAVVWDEAPPVVATEGDLPAAAAAVATTYGVMNYDATGQPVVAQLVGGQWFYTPSREWVREEVAAIVDSAPQDLDTLREFAAALGDDANFAATVNSAIAGRVRKAGDTMTGPLLTVTPAADDVSKKGVNSEWTMARIQESAGTVLAAARDLALGATTDVNLSEPLTGLRWLRLIASRRQAGGGRVVVDGGIVPVASLRAPNVGNALIAVVNGVMYDIDTGTGDATNPTQIRGDSEGIDALSQGAGMATGAGGTYFVGVNGSPVQALNYMTNDIELVGRGEAIQAWQFDATNAYVTRLRRWAVLGRVVNPAITGPVTGVSMVIDAAGEIFVVFLVPGETTVTRRVRTVSLDRVSGTFVDRGRLSGTPGGAVVGNALASFVLGGVVYVVIDRAADTEERLQSFTISAGSAVNQLANVGADFGQHLRVGFGAHSLAGTAYLMAAPGTEGPITTTTENLTLYTVNTAGGPLTEVGDTGLSFAAENAALAAPLLHRDGVETGVLRAWRQADDVLRLRPVSSGTGVRIEQVVGYQ